MEENKIFYSIIIPTYNRANTLRQNLKNITQLDYPKGQYEVIIIDDGSTDDSKKVVESFPEIKYKYINNQGAPQARNLGAGLASGEVLIFIDDDCFPANDYLNNQDKFWRNSECSNLGILGGAIVGVSKTFFGKLCDYLDSYTIYEGLITKACTSNFSINRYLFHQHKGFNPFLKGAEDVDLSLRVKRSGYQVYFSSKIKIFHHHTKRVFGNLIKRTWSWALGGEAHLALKYPDQLYPIDKLVNKIYNPFLKKIRTNIHPCYIIIFPFLGLIRALVRTYELHSDNRKSLGFKLQYFPFTFIIYLVYEMAFLYYLISHRRRHFWNLRNKFSKNIFSPSNLLFSVTSACNYQCDHCFYHEYLNSKNDLSSSDLIKIIKKFQKIDEISLTGGEPFLREDLTKILESFYLNSRPFEISIPTNGWFQERIINTTKKLLEDLPLSKINLFLSFHGLEKIHDSITHIPGSFKRTLETGKLIQKYFSGHPRLNLSSLICIHSKNIGNIEELINHIQEKLPRIHMNFFSSRGKVKDISVQHLNPKQISKLADFRRILQERKGNFNTIANISQKIFQQDLENGYQYNIKTNKQFIPCFAAIGVSKLEETGIWRPCEGSKQCLDLTKYLDEKEIKSMIYNIKKQQCSCTHDCFFKPSLDSSPLYKIKNYAKTAVTYLQIRKKYT